MVTIWPYSMGGRLMPANTPLGLFESSAACDHRPANQPHT